MFLFRITVQKKLKQRSQVLWRKSRSLQLEPREMAIKLNYSSKLVTAQKFGFSRRAAREAAFYNILCRFERNSLTSILISFWQGYNFYEKENREYDLSINDYYHEIYFQQ